MPPEPGDGVAFSAMAVGLSGLIEEPVPCECVSCVEAEAAGHAA